MLHIEYLKLNFSSIFVKNENLYYVFRCDNCFAHGLPGICKWKWCRGTVNAGLPYLPNVWYDKTSHITYSYCRFENLVEMTIEEFMTFLGLDIDVYPCDKTKDAYSIVDILKSIGDVAEKCEDNLETLFASEKAVAFLDENYQNCINDLTLYINRLPNNCIEYTNFVSARKSLHEKSIMYEKLSSVLKHVAGNDTQNVNEETDTQDVNEETDTQDVNEETDTKDVNDKTDEQDINNTNVDDKSIDYVKVNKFD